MFSGDRERSGDHVPVLHQLLADYITPEWIIGENGLLKQWTKAILKRALQGRAGRTPGARISRSVSGSITMFSWLASFFGKWWSLER